MFKGIIVGKIAHYLHVGFIISRTMQQGQGGIKGRRVIMKGARMKNVDCVRKGSERLSQAVTQGGGRNAGSYLCVYFIVEQGSPTGLPDLLKLPLQLHAPSK